MFDIASYRFAPGLFGKSILDDGGASGGFASDLTLLAFISVVILVGECAKQFFTARLPKHSIFSGQHQVILSYQPMMHKGNKNANISLVLVHHAVFLCFYSVF